MADNTVISVVHEFSILYSSRVFQRDKKWSDGLLKYYEFNGKMEILCDDGSIVATDFVHPRNQPLVLTTKLVVDKQFTLSTNKLIIEITDQLSTYTREVSFKKPVDTKKREPVVKQEPKYTPNLSIHPRVIIKKEYTEPIPTQHRRRIGLRPVKRTSKSNATPTATQIKKEQQEPNDHPIKVKIERESPKKSTLVKLEPTSPKVLNREQVINNRRIAKLLPVRKTLFTPPRHLTDKVSRLVNVFAYIDSFNVPIARIPAKSSAIFKFIQNGKETHPVRIKQESGPFHLKKDINSADIIYDLSDFEEDVQFQRMLKERTIPNPADNVNTSNDTEEADDFDLSATSEVDDIDLQ